MAIRQLSPLQQTRAQQDQCGEGVQKEEPLNYLKGLLNSKFYFTLLATRCFFLFIFFKVFLSFGCWRSYQTGIHHKSTPSPELGQLLAAQRYDEAGEQSARHQVEQGGLTHLHQSQRHEGDEQADAVRCHERRRQKNREVLLARRTMQISHTWMD